MNLSILENQRFTCHNCGNCCKHWHVQLIDDEPQKIANFAPKSDVLLTHQGNTYLKHRPNGDCIFLNPENGLCLLHEQFGEEAKPLGCQLFPFRLTRTLNDQVTVMGRYDCPSVRQNKGEPLNEAALRKLASSVLADAAPLTEQQVCQLDTDQLQAVTEFLATLLPSLGNLQSQAVFLHLFCDWLSHQEIADLDRLSLGEAYQPLKQHTEIFIAQATAQSLRSADRFAYRSLLAMYLRRDEDILDKRVNRFKRMTAIVSFARGSKKISPAHLGTVHAAHTTAASKLFQTPTAPLTDQTAFTDLIRMRLQTLQFFGSVNLGLDMLDGLRSLALLYPLYIGAMGLFSNADDALGAIDHAYGQAPTLRTKTARRFERQLLNPEVFVKLVVSV